MEKKFKVNLIARKKFSIKGSDIKPIEINDKSHCDVRFFGSLYDEFFKKELSKINFKVRWAISRSSIHRHNIHYKSESTNNFTLDKIVFQLKRSRFIKETDNIDLIARHMYNLLIKADYSLFKAKDIFIETCTFWEVRQPNSRHCGVAMVPDFIIDNKIIDIKTYCNVKLKKSDLLKLITYAIWANNIDVLYGEPEKYQNEHIRYYKKPLHITEVGLFFSRHNYLWKTELHPFWVSEGRRFIIENKYSPTLKSDLEKLMWYICFLKTDKEKRVYAKNRLYENVPNAL